MESLVVATGGLSERCHDGAVDDLFCWTLWACSLMLLDYDQSYSPGSLGRRSAPTSIPLFPSLSPTTDRPPVDTDCLQAVGARRTTTNLQRAGPAASLVELHGECAAMA
jgi:hypothetical protein